MIGNANIRKVKKFEYDINARNMSYVSSTNAMCLLESAANLDTMTPITVTDGGGVPII